MCPKTSFSCLSPWSRVKDVRAPFHLPGPRFCHLLRTPSCRRAVLRVGVSVVCGTASYLRRLVGGTKAHCYFTRSHCDFPVTEMKRKGSRTVPNLSPGHSFKTKLFGRCYSQLNGFFKKWVFKRLTCPRRLHPCSAADGSPCLRGSRSYLVLLAQELKTESAPVG